MRYIKQFLIILAFSFVGEALNRLLPLPVPASIYGIVLLFLALETRLLPKSAIKETADFLVAIMPIMFVPAAVGLIDAWDIVAPSILPYIAMTFLTTFIVMGVSGKATEGVLYLTRRRASAKRVAEEKEEHADVK